jgi:3-oxoacyl-[acyl-carrier protein] reductase/(S)-1-phenylethanol dehydrogenase
MTFISHQMPVGVPGPPRRERAAVADGGLLTGYVAVVTGGARATVRACAHRLAADGASVAMLDVADPPSSLGEVEATGPTSLALAVDVTDPSQVSEAARVIEAALGAPDILINTGSCHPSQALGTTSIADWRWMFGVNAELVHLTCQAFAPAMQRRGWGRIVNMTSNATGLVIPGFTSYLATKVRRRAAASRWSAVHRLTQQLAAEFAASGVTVNAIGPSLVRTRSSAARSAVVFELVTQVQATQRAHVCEDLLDTLAFLVSDDAGLINGQTIHLDRGLLRPA